MTESFRLVSETLLNDLATQELTFKRGESDQELKLLMPRALYTEMVGRGEIGQPQDVTILELRVEG